MLSAHEIIVDNFAGGGGASTGIEWATGRDVDIAINHSPNAIALHRANHPRTEHYCEDVWHVSPTKAARGRPVGLAHFSPDCTHFSRAKGGKPREKKTRALAWVVLRWAREVSPRVIVLENVEEFLTWGPVDNDGQPIAAKRGLTFRVWLGKLRALGYTVDWRVLNAADYGAPTTRRRLFLVARRDGAPIRWPSPTHGRGLRPWRGAHEVIDWSLPAPSIFERARPLADATLRRIAAGVQRFIIDAARPFVAPTGDAATLIQMGYGERAGQAPRVPGVAKPLGTVVAGGGKHGLVAAMLTKHYGGVVGHGVQLPLGTITTQDHHALTTARLAKSAARASEVRAFLVKYYGSESSGQPLQLPLHTVTTKDRFGLVMVHGEPYEIADIGMRMLAPRELFRAQSFPDDYVIDAGPGGRALTKSEQIELAGNSVCPVVEAAVVGAQLGTAPQRIAA